MERILIIPMAAMAETGGPASRCRLLAEGMRDRGFQVATCMAEDVNFIKLDGIKNYYLDIPMPMGLPKVIAHRTFPIAQKLGITKRKTVSSFDQVLRFTGNLDYRYLRKSVESIRKAIQAFQPDIIYSEFNLSAYIAAELEHVRLAATVSFPTQADYACVPKLAGGLNRLLKEYGLLQVNSALDLFDRPEVKICPSIPELEPFNRQDVIYSGTWKMVQKRQCKRNKIVVYMGNGTISAPRTEKVVREAFSGSRRFDVYIASSYLKEKEEGNIHIAERWDFNELLDEAALFINHGGQNSIVDGLIHGVPQIMVPGKVFERKYNAGAVADNNAGTLIMSHEFEPKHLRATAKKLILSKEARKNASRLGEKLLSEGGIEQVIHELL